MTIKAIETQYKGYRFRSRLEARWAGVRYLPDFWLPEANVWLEVKPDGPWTSDSGAKAFTLARSMNVFVVLTHGAPPVTTDAEWPRRYLSAYGPFTNQGEEFSRHVDCSDGGINLFMRAASGVDRWGHYMSMTKEQQRRFDEAALMARQARFGANDYGTCR